MKKLSRVLAIVLVLAMVLPGLAQAAPQVTTDEGVTRIAGANRWETAVAASEEAYDSAETVVIVNGRDSADALTGTVLAHAENAPLLLVDRKNDLVPSVVEKEIKRLGAKKAIIVGGPVAVSEKMEAALEKLVDEVERVKGDNRYETAVKVAEAAKVSKDLAFLVKGDDFADALAVGPVAALKKAPIFLTKTDKLNDATKEALKDYAEVVVVGGKVAVSEAVYQAADADKRLEGASRWATALKVAEEYFAGASRAYVANGRDFPDALVAGYLGAKYNAPVLLVKADAVEKDVVEYLDGKDVYVLGGPKVVGKKAVEAIVGEEGELKVVSVSAINGKQVEVKFSKAMDKGTLLESDAKLKNIVFNRTTNASDDVTYTTATGKLSSDGTVLTITLAGDEVFKGTYTITINKNAKGKDGEALKDYSTTFSITDKTAPVIQSVEAKTNTTTATSAKVKFSEPVSAVVVKINGKVETPADGAGTDELVFNGLSLSTSKEHTVQIMNATDYSGNVTALQNKTFTVIRDTVAPTVSVKASGDSHIELIFDKDMNTASVTSGTAVKVLDEKLGTVTSATTKPGTSNKEFLIKIIDSNMYDDSNSRTYTVVVDDTAKDSLGNKVSVTSKTVKLTKDTTAPTVVSIVVKNDSSGNAETLKVTFSEKIKAKPNDLSKVKAKDATTGQTVDVTDILDDTAVNIGLSEDGKTVEIPVKVAARGNKYNLIFEKGFVEDKALVANESVAYSKTVSFEKEGTSFKLVQGDLDTSTVNKIVISYDKEIVGDFGSNAANNPANYTVAGNALPADANIEVASNRQTVTITLPNNFIAKTDSSAVFTVNNVKALDGSLLSAFVGFANVEDNIPPILKEAKWNSNGTVTLEFDEDIDSIGTVAGYEVKLNGKVLPVSAYALAAGVGSDAGKVVVILTEKTDSTYGKYIDVNEDDSYSDSDILVGNITDISIKILDNDNAPKDAATNNAKAGSTASATK